VEVSPVAVDLEAAVSQAVRDSNSVNFKYYLFRIFDMDALAHFLWTIIILHKLPSLGLALFFSVAPDAFSWGLANIYLLTKHRKFPHPKKLDQVPTWVFTLYGLTHSLFVFAAVFIIVMVSTQSFPFYLIAWLMHILMDIPLHSRDFLPTPFLWPFSDYKFPGIKWWSRRYILLNYAIIILVFMIK
jgi:hypothetical protein